MDVSTIIEKSRVQTSTNVTQKTDAKMLADLNEVYKDIFSRLAVKSKKYARDYFYTDLIEGQNEYVLPKWSTTDVWVKRVLKVGVKEENELVNYPIFDTSVRDDDNWDGKPYCINRDWSIFLYPTPKKSVEWWITIQAQYLPVDLAMDSTTADIKLPPEYHNILLIWLNMYCFGDKQMIEKKIQTEQEYENALARATSEGWADIEDWYETPQAEIIMASQTFLP